MIRPAASVFSAVAVLAAVLCLAVPARAQDTAFPEAASGRSGLKGGSAERYMVVAAHPLAAQAGAEILAAGGSAVDAAVAVQLVLTMVEPQSSGIGGGAFMLHWDAQAKAVTSYDGRETAPAAAAEDRFLNPDGSVMSRGDAIVGGKSVGVPGVLRMLELAHSRHGRLPWARLFAPAIRIAEDGFEISPRLNALLEGESALRQWEPARSFYYRPDGSAKPVGTLLKNPALAKTLRILAEEGAGAFYKGAIAADIVRAAASAPNNPSDMTLADLEGYVAKERTPVCGAYRQKRICGMGPPSSGGIGVIQTLGALERFDLRAMGPESVAAYHVMAEAGRLALADRAVYIADSDFVPVPADGLVAPDYLAKRGQLIELGARMPQAPAGRFPVKETLNLVPALGPERPSTSHLSVVDAFGNAVAMTTSIENGFGSRLMVDGFLLNNQLTDFSYSDVARGQTAANRVQGGKRPRSSMAPTMVFDETGEFEIAAGSPGGPAIVAFVAKALIAMIDWDMTPAEAVAAPNLTVGRGIEVEAGTFLEKAKGQFEAMGHGVRVDNYPSGLHVIRRMPDGRLLGGADPRREGIAVGR